MTGRKQMQGHVLTDVPLLQIPTNHEALQMLTRKTPDTLATEIKLKGQGEEIKFNVTYHNRTPEAQQQVLDAANASDQGKADIGYGIRESVLYVVKEMESEYPLTHDGQKEMEADRPGMIEVLFYGFHQARRVELLKN
jgi:hypothetical protein